MPRPPSRSVRTLVRTSLPSRLQPDFLERAYELALPILRRRGAGKASAQAAANLNPFPVPQQRMGG